MEVIVFISGTHHSDMIKWKMRVAHAKRKMRNEAGIPKIKDDSCGVRNHPQMGFFIIDEILADNVRVLSKKEIISNTIRTSMRNCVIGKQQFSYIEDVLGYTIDELYKRLNETMPDGYTWDDFIGGDLHIDHIIPVSVFNFDNPSHIDFKRCWALDNLQLLPARENCVKNAKIDKPFQPSLKLSI